MQNAGVGGCGVLPGRVGAHVGSEACAPIAQFDEDGDEVEALLGEFVALLAAISRRAVFGENSFSHEAAKPVGEQAGGDLLRGTMNSPKVCLPWKTTSRTTSIDHESPTTSIATLTAHTGLRSWRFTVLGDTEIACWHDIEALRRDFGSSLGQQVARDADHLAGLCPGMRSAVFDLRELQFAS